MNRIALLALPALALVASCGSKDGNTTSSAPVAAAKPPTGTQWATTVVETPDGGFLMGNPNAALKLVEYGSRTCPHCAKFSAESSTGLPKYIETGKVSYEFRDFPIHAPDLAAILLGRCGGSAPFFTILEQMYSAQPDMLPKLEGLSPELQAKAQAMSPIQQATFWADTVGYRQFVEQRGVTAAQANACLSDTGVIDKLNKSLATADTKYKIQGTPTFILNGDVMADINTWAGVEQALRAAGA
ncbi:thioredoxin domain-containing protein [Sphingomonas sp.]|uniref:thioredoxin domain-containing protein n=1 Tax=Sphingomonas sp. TaxID=28214 RepID=UPI002600009D|nr:thioredoxin domain-containing protein [Sphingomonas sp.]